jgi:hypothetical protein
MLPQRQIEPINELKHQKTENSLKRSESYPSIVKEQLPVERENDVDSYDNKVIDTSQIRLDLEDELDNQKEL